MSNLIIKNASVVLADKTINASILIENGKIAKIGEVAEAKGVKTIDATGLTVMAGLVDIHVHLRDPGQEYKEDLQSGARAAIKGGVTTIACMPNTAPFLDNPALITYIKARGEQINLCKILPIGAITKAGKGKDLAEIGLMQRAGAVAFSDDGSPVSNPAIMRSALEYAKTHKAILISHSEEKELSAGGEVNEGYNSTISGLKPIPQAAEEIAIFRDIALAKSFGSRLHIAHVSTKGSVDIIRTAKKQGLDITAETCPHYFSLTDDAVLTFDTSTKVNPPLRTKEDVKAIIQGLKDGTIDCIATDHAPHHIDDKVMEYSNAAFGISGLETSFALSYTKLVKENGFTLNQLTKLMTTNPKNALKLSSGTLEVGQPADLCIVDLNKKFKVDKTKFVSKGKNTPFDGMTLYGEVKHTVVDGVVKTI